MNPSVYFLKVAWLKNTRSAWLMLNMNRRLQAATNSSFISTIQNVIAISFRTHQENRMGALCACLLFCLFGSVLPITRSMRRLTLEGQATRKQIVYCAFGVPLLGDLFVMMKLRNRCGEDICQVIFRVRVFLEAEQTWISALNLYS